MITNFPSSMQSICALICISLCTFCYAQPEQQWKLEKDQDGVAVYSREASNGYIQVRVNTQVKTNPSSLIRLLDDTNAAPEWIAHCRSVEIMDWFANTKRTVRTNFSAPWPLKDRDMITSSSATIDPTDKSVVIKVSDKGNQYATLSNYQRMRNVQGTWTTKVLEGGVLDISYQGYGEAAGSIPRWLANKLLISSSHETFSQLKKVIILEKYQDPAGDQITE